MFSFFSIMKQANRLKK